MKTAALARGAVADEAPETVRVRVKRHGQSEVETVTVARAARLIRSGEAEPHAWDLAALDAVIAAIRAREQRARARLVRDGLLLPDCAGQKREARFPW